MFDCKLHEAEVTDLTEYRNLRQFFTRKLRRGVRHVHGRLPLVGINVRRRTVQPICCNSSQKLHIFTI